MITVGCIVKLDGTKYKVHEVVTNRGLTYPYRVSVIDRHGVVDSTILTDRYDTWSRLSWVVIEQAVPVDPKAKIIAKIKYLDEKFKKNQERKAQLKAGNPVETTSFTELTAEQLREYVTRVSASARTSSPYPSSVSTIPNWTDLVRTNYER